MLETAQNVRLTEARPKDSIVVCIVGSNQKLADACRVNLQQLCPAGYQIQQCASLDASGGCDIYLWDFESSPFPPPVMLAAGEATKIVLVQRSSLSSVRRKLPGVDFTHLPTPVSPLALRAVLASAIARWHLGHGGVRPSHLELDRDRIFRQLLQTNLKLREHDQDRTNFLTRSIHDIRVPLMAVQGYCGLLVAGQVGPLDPEPTRILERMQRSLTRLGGLVEAMLALATGSPLTNKLNLEQASIETCVQQSVYEIAPFVEKKQITLRVEVEPPDGVLLFDPGQVEQVLLNLLDNACKFTPKGGAITIRARSVTAQELGKLRLLEASAGYSIDVTDTGRGIDPDHIEEIFDERTSFGNPMDRSGSGLGLAICRMIVEAHNGRIWADSTSHGASFSFVLPLVRSFNDSNLSQPSI